MQNRSLETSMMSGVAGSQDGSTDDQNNMSSLFAASFIIDTVIDKVNQIQYMQTVEKKILPYTVLQTTLQGLKVVQTFQIDYDHKVDDKYLMSQDDLIEPQGLGKDSCQSVTKVNQKDPVIMIRVSQEDENGPHSNIRRESSNSAKMIKIQSFKNAYSRSLIGSDLSVRGIKNKTVYQVNKVGASPNLQASPNRPLEETNEMLSSSAIAFHKKKPSFASQRVDESVSEAGVNSVTSHEGESNQNKLYKNKRPATLHSSDFYQAQVINLEAEKNEEDLDEELQTKLAELRVEVMKRDIQRKFEAIQTQQTKRGSGGRKNGAPGNPLMGGAAQNAKVTTDHEGNVIAVRSGAVAFTKPMVTTVTISKAVSSVPIGGVPNSNKQRRVTVVEDDSKLRRTQILSINGDGNDNRRGSHLSIVESEGDIQRAYMNQNAERILGNTVSSNFANKRGEKSFANIQTVEYEQSIFLDKSHMSDGVAMVDNHSGSHARLGTHVHTAKQSSNNLKGISKISSRQNFNHVQSVQNSATRPPLTQHMDHQSFLSGPVNNQLMTPDANIRRSMQQVDYASPDSHGTGGGGLLEHLNKQNAIYASDANLHQQDDGEMHTNSLMSMQSRLKTNNIQSKSMVRGRLGYGRIMTQNASEVASIIADSVQQMQSKHVDQSRHDMDGSLYSVGPQHHNSYDNRGSSISRILGKQSSQKRLHDQFRGLSAQKNSESVSAIGKSPLHTHKFSNLHTETSRIEANLQGQRLGSHQRPVASAINCDVNSFSYLPSIQGTYRSKMQSGPSTDIVGRVRRRYGGLYPGTGKSPLLMANHRRMLLDNGLSRASGGGIKMVDQARAKDLIDESSKEKIAAVSTTVSQNGGKRIRNLTNNTEPVTGGSEVIKDNYVGGSRRSSTDSKPTIKTVASGGV